MFPQCTSLIIAIWRTLAKHLMPGFQQSPKVNVSYQHIPFTKTYKSTERGYFIETSKLTFNKNGLGSNNGYNQEKTF